MQAALSFPFLDIYFRKSYASIKTFTSGGAPINQYDGDLFFSNGGDVDTAVYVQKTFIANAGEIVRSDIYSKIDYVNPVSGNVYLVQNTNPSLEYSFFSGIGYPLVPLELNPVNIDDVKAYIYKFNRPLTMAEINAITSETSKPINIGRYDDPLAVIPTYIKTLNIESVMRKNTTFELLSNKLLP